MITAASPPVDNQPSYKPTLDFYCHVSVGDGVWGIQDIT
jgi:hypothetical protein